MCCSGFSKELSEGGEAKILIAAEEMSSNKEEALLHFSAEGLDKMDWFGKSDPFLELSRSTESNQYILVHRSEVIKKTLNPEWKQFNIKVRALGTRGPHAAALDHHPQTFRMLPQRVEEALFQPVSGNLIFETSIEAKLLLLFSGKTGKLFSEVSLCSHRERNCWQKCFRDKSRRCLGVVEHTWQVPGQKQISHCIAVGGWQHSVSTQIEDIWMAEDTNCFKLLSLSPRSWSKSAEELGNKLLIPRMKGLSQSCGKMHLCS